MTNSLKQELNINEATLTRFMNGDIKNSAIWALAPEEDRSYSKTKIVIHKPTGLRMKAIMWDPFKWVINTPSIGEC